MKKFLFTFFLLFCFYAVLFSNPFMKNKYPGVVNSQDEIVYDNVNWYPFEIKPPFGEVPNPDDPSVIFAGSGRIVARHGFLPPPIPQELKINAPLGSLSAYYIVHFVGEIQTEWIEKLKKAGAVYSGNYLAHNSQVVWMTPEVYQRVKTIPEIDWIGYYEPAYKIDPMIGNMPIDLERYANIGVSNFIIVLFKKVEPEVVRDKLLEKDVYVLDDLEEIRKDIHPHPDWLPWVLTVEAPYEKILEMAKIDEIQYIQEAAKVRMFRSWSAGGIMQSGGTSFSSWAALGSNDPGSPPTATFFPLWVTRNLRGQHQVVGIADSGIDYGYSAGEFELFSQPVNPFHTTVKSGGVDLKVPYASLRDGSPNVCDADDGHGTGVAGSCCQDKETLETTNWRYSNASGGDVGDSIAHEAQIVIATSNWSSFNYNQQRLQWLDIGSSNGGNASVMNTSWSWCTGITQNYDSQSMIYDDVMNSNEKFLITNACGNDGSCGTWNTNVNCQTSNWAKGPIDVGASDDLSRLGQTIQNGVNGVTWSSNKGPNWANPPGSTGDKRVFPDVVSVAYDTTQTNDGTTTANADGTCNNNDAYFWYFGGTSASAPTVAGAVALVHQYFEEGNYPSIPDPSGALMKAMIINSTVKMEQSTCQNTGRPGGDQGWGRPDLSQVLAFSDSGFKLNAYDILNSSGDAFTASGQYHEYAVTISDTSRPLKITLVWTDEPASVGAPAPYMVNNLNLRFTKGGTTYYGNNFDPATGWAATTTGIDGANTIENIFLSPSQVASIGTGTGIIRVTMANNPNSRAQGYALVITGGILGAITGYLDKSLYVCTDSVSGTIEDPGTPTNVKYRASSGGQVNATVSGGPPTWTVSSTTISALGAGDGDTIWLEFTGSDSITRQSNSRLVKCTWDIDLLGGFYVDADGDGYIDCTTSDGTITLTGIAYNNDTYTAPGVVGTLSCISNCSGITITDNTVIYGNIGPGSYSNGAGDTYAFQVSNTVPSGTVVTFEIDFAGTGWNGIPPAPDPARQFVFRANLDNQASGTFYDFESGFQGWTPAGQPLSPNLGCSISYTSNWRLAGASETGATQAVVHNWGAPSSKQIVEDPNITGDVVQYGSASPGTWLYKISSTYNQGTVSKSTTINCPSGSPGGSVQLQTQTGTNRALVALVFSIFGDGDFRDNLPIGFRSFILPETAHTISFQFQKQRGTRVPRYNDLYMNIYNGFDGISSYDVLGVDLWSHTSTNNFSCTAANVNWTTPADFIGTEIEFLGILVTNANQSHQITDNIDSVNVNLTGTYYSGDTGFGIDAGLDSPAYSVPTIDNNNNYGTRVGLYWSADTLARSAGGAFVWSGATGNVFAGVAGTFTELEAIGGYPFSTTGDFTCHNPYDSLFNGFIGGDGTRGGITGDTFSYEEMFDLDAFSGQNVNLRLRFGAPGCNTGNCPNPEEYPGIIGQMRGIYWDNIKFYNKVKDANCYVPSSPPPTPNNDDVPGQPFKLTKGTNPGTVRATWDPSCGSPDNFNIYWGNLNTIRTTKTVTNQNCGIGISGDVDNLTSPSPAAGEGYWAVITAVKGSAFGRHGNDSNGVERSLTGDAAACGGTKDITKNDCSLLLMSSIPEQKWIPQTPMTYPLKLVESKPKTQKIEFLELKPELKFDIQNKIKKIEQRIEKKLQK